MHAHANRTVHSDSVGMYLLCRAAVVAMASKAA